MRGILILLFLSGQMVMGNSDFWSKTGHRVIGEAVSNYADEIKSDRAFKNFSAWHYVNIPSDKKYTEVKPSTKDDLVTGIQKCIEILKNKNSTEADRIFYLKMLVHLIGDLHQPLHAGRKEDKGGNDIQLQWFGKGTNLHRVWDSNMINDYGMSYSEFSRELPALGKERTKEIQKGTILDWVGESQELANEIYDSVEKGEKLGYSYSYEHWNIVEEQLQKGGMRLARVLNDIFS